MHSKDLAKNEIFKLRILNENYIRGALMSYYFDDSKAHLDKYLSRLDNEFSKQGESKGGYYPPASYIIFEKKRMIYEL